MTTVRIYQPSKTAMQSGKKKTRKWRIEFETKDPLLTEPLMGWVAAYDMSQELQLSFPTLREALEFAKEKGVSYTVYNPSTRVVAPKSYATNFTNPRVRGC
jgi:hypothetical protein